MATDVEMTDAAPWDGELPLPSVVEKWTPEKLFGFAPIQKILWNEKNRAIFWNAVISGKAFLRDGDVRDFWLHLCGLPIGPSGDLADLAQKIKNMGKEESPVKGTKPPQSLERVQATNLYRLLWDKGKTLRDHIFVTKSVTVPTFLPDGSQDYSYTELSLRTSITEFLQRTPGEDPKKWLRLLPCRSDALVFREAYREMLDLIKESEERHGYMGEGERPQRETTHSCIILTGNPGIGKTWFQSAILVDRLLAGLPTVLQTGKHRGGEQFILFYQHGVAFLHELAPDDPIYANVEVWALADQEARGILDDFQKQEWLTIVTSSPREENYKQLQKASAALVWYMPVWDWSEIVAASRLMGITELRPLWDQFHMYGPVPRLLLQTLYSPNQRERDMRIESYDSRIRAKIAEYVQSPTVGDQIVFSEHDSHALLVLEPVVKAPLMHNSALWVRRVITPAIAEELAKGSHLYSEEKAYRLYRLLLGHPSTSTVAGWMFEAKAHTALSRVDASFEPRCISTHSTATLKFRVKRCPDSMTGTFDSRQLEDTFRQEKSSSRFDNKLDSVYMRPLQQNLPAIDSLMVIMEGHSPRAVLFEITVAENHPISGPALSKVWNGLPNEVKGVDPAIVFVVPYDRAAGYKKQNIEGTTGSPATWPQFVLGLDKYDLWPSGVSG